MLKLLEFQSTTLLRGSTIDEIQLYLNSLISIHDPLARIDASYIYTVDSYNKFQSTTLLRGSTFYAPDFDSLDLISIHDPLARIDGDDREGFDAAWDISIHDPLARIDIVIFYLLLLS